jgi:hypothetical protein
MEKLRIKPRRSDAMLAPAEGGRPTKFTPQVLKRILRSARRGLPLSLIARAVGVSVQGLINFRKANERFEQSLQRSIARGADTRLKKIEEAANAKDWRAAAWLLEHCQPEHFAKNRIEVTGADGGPLAGAVVVLPCKGDGDGGSLPVVSIPMLT